MPHINSNQVLKNQNNLIGTKLVEVSSELKLLKSRGVLVRALLRRSLTAGRPGSMRAAAASKAPVRQNKPDEVQVASKKKALVKPSFVPYKMRRQTIQERRRKRPHPTAMATSLCQGQNTYSHTIDHILQFVKRG